MNETWRERKMKKFEVTIRHGDKPVDDFVAAKTVAVRIIAEHMDLIKDAGVLKITVSEHDNVFEEE